MKAVIVGATGLTGTFVLEELLRDARVSEVVSVSRRSCGVENPKLVEHLIENLGDLSGLEDQLKGDVYFCCLGTTIKAAGSKSNFRKVDEAAVIEFGKIAKKHNASALLVVSAQGANPNSSIFYNKVKGQMERSLGALNLRSLVIFRPALLTGPRKDFRLAENLVTHTLVPLLNLLPTGLKRGFITEARHLAQRMCAEAAAPSPGLKLLRASSI